MCGWPGWAGRCDLVAAGGVAPFRMPRLASCGGCVAAGSGGVATIEVSEDALRRAASGEVFARAVQFVDAGKVGDLRAGGPDAVRELADHVITRIEGVLDYENCFGSDLTEALERAQELHLQACRAGSPDVSRLAGRLVTGALEGGWGVFTDGIARYADVLGPAGLARCRELLARQTGERHGLEELRASLARAEKGLAQEPLAEEADVES